MRIDKVAVALDGSMVRVMLGRTTEDRPDVDFSLCHRDARQLADAISAMLFAATADARGPAS